jgi:large subunit ribosomal protein L4
VVSGFVTGDAPKTSEALDVLRAAVGLLAEKLRVKVLVVTQADDELAWKSLRNVPSVRLLAVGQLNTYDVLASEHVVFTQAALEEFTGRTVLAKDGAPATKDAAPARKTAKKEDEQ